MKKILCVVCLLFLFGCGSSPDFSKENRIIYKTTNGKDVATYTLNNWSNNSFFAKGEFFAPYSFAKVGDIVKCENGVIRVIKKKEK